MSYLLALLAARALLSAASWEKRALGAARAVETAAAREPAALGIDSRLRAAELLRATHPQLARKFALDVVAALQKTKDTGSANLRVTEILMLIDPAEAERVAATLPSQPWVQNALMMYWIRQQDWARAAEVARRGLRAGVRAGNVSYLLGQMADKDPAGAAALFRDVLEAFPREKATLEDARSLLRSMPPVIERDPEALRLATRCLLELAASESFNAGGREEILACFRFGLADGKVGKHHIDTNNGRETVLVPVAMYLFILEPETYRKNEKLFALWHEQIKELKPAQLAKAAEPFAWLHTSKEQLPKGVKVHYDPPREPGPDYAKMPFREAFDKIQELNAEARPSYLMHLLPRKDLTAAERATLARELLAGIPRMSLDHDRLGTAERFLQTCADQELKAWIKPAATLLLEVLSDLEKCPSRYCQMTHERDGARTWAALAETQRRERIRLPASNPSLASRTALLDLRDALEEPFDFKLASADGKEHTLKQHRGKVVMLNFWASW